MQDAGVGFGHGRQGPQIPAPAFVHAHFRKAGVQHRLAQRPRAEPGPMRHVGIADREGGLVAEQHIECVDWPGRRVIQGLVDFIAHDMAGNRPQVRQGHQGEPAGTQYALELGQCDRHLE